MVHVILNGRIRLHKPYVIAGHIHAQFTIMILEEGFRVSGYRVSDFIKEGLFNSTYRVVDEQGKSYFMKFFEDERVPEKLMHQGDILEIALSRRVSHENVISYVNDGTLSIEGKSYHYLITEFFHGTLLSELLSEGKVFSYQEAKDLMCGVIKGLLYLHSLHLNHNDLTPRNIILEKAGRDQYIPRIIDLGHLYPAISGTPPFPVADLNLTYCAPESLTGIFENGGDTFSAAAVFYTMLTGKAPWPCDLSNDDSYSSKKRKVRNARKEPLDLCPLSDIGVPDNIVETISMALDLDAGRRLHLESFFKVLSGDKVIRTQGQQEKKENIDILEDDKGQDQHSQVTAVKVQIQKKKGGGFDDVAGMEKLKAEMTNRVIWILRDREKAEKYRLSPPNGMILYGPPGCGKTFFAEKFAEESQFNFVLVNGSDLGSIYIHGTQGKIANLFKEAEKKAPTILCFDEFDSFVPSRSSMAAEHRPEEINEFLGQLNNCAQRGIFVIGTTNRLDLIDPAILRKGRMDLHFEIPAPDENTRMRIFSLHLKDRPVSNDIDCAELAKLTDHYASSDIAFIVNEAAMMAALADVPISQTHLVNSIKANKSSLASGQERKKIGF